MGAGESSSAPVLDLVIPGAQKAGTSSLIDVLGEHPHIFRHETPEYSPLMNSGTDLDESVSADFGRSQHGQVLLAKSAGVLHSPTAIERIVDHNREIKFLVILRDPARRAYSAFLHAQRVGQEHESDFRTAWDLQDNARRNPDRRTYFVEYRRRSEYLAPLRFIRDSVGESRLRVVTLEEFHADQAHVLDGVTAWLGVAPMSHDIPTQRSNAASASRSAGLARALRRDTAVRSVVKQILPVRIRRAAFRAVERLNRRESPSTSMSRDDYLAVSEEFSEHNQQLREEFGVSTSHWTFN